jgi:hypothetical protein
MAFNKIRRQKFLSESQYTYCQAKLTDHIGSFRSKIVDQKLHADA